MDIGVYWSAAVLEHKLERRDRPGRVEEVWNVRRCPQGMGQSPTGDRLVVASDKRWRGFFRLVPEVLFNPKDPSCPYALIFDAKSWTLFAHQLPCQPFRGWTYAVPAELSGQDLPDPPDHASPPAKVGHNPAAPARRSAPGTGSRRRRRVDHS